MQDSITFEIGTQFIDLASVNINGKVLDIGGGGEGVISQLVGEHVISIDPSIEELKEAPSNSIKIVMNAENLLSNSVLYDIMKADIIGGETMNGMNVNVRVCLFVEDIEKMVSFYKNIRFMIRQ